MLRQLAGRPPDSKSKGRNQSHNRRDHERNDTQRNKRNRRSDESNSRKDCPIFPGHPTAQDAIKNEETDYQSDCSALYSALEKGKLKSP